MAYFPPRDPTAVVGRRVVAFLIDIVLVGAISFAVFAALRTQTYSGAPTDACQRLREVNGFSGTCIRVGSYAYTWTGGRVFLGWLVGLALGFLNLVVLQGITGASVGKFIVGLRVTDQQGNVCGVGRAFIRWLLLLIDYVACFLIGLITVSVTHPHRRLGDMAAGTDVVATGDVGAVPSALPYGVPPPPPGPAGFGQPAPSPWGAPPPPAPVQPTWGTAPPTWGTPPPAPPPSWGAPPPRPSQPIPPSEPIPSPEPIPPSEPIPSSEPIPPSQPSGGESWWERINEDDDEPKL